MNNINNIDELSGNHASTDPQQSPSGRNRSYEGYAWLLQRPVLTPFTYSGFGSAAILGALNNLHQTVHDLQMAMKLYIIGLDE